MAQDFNRVFGSTGTSDTFSDTDYNEGLRGYCWLCTAIEKRSTTAYGKSMT